MENRIGTATTSPTTTQADEFLRRARAHHSTEPLPAAAIAALERLERALNTHTVVKAVA
ncbi:hypothetical protein ACL07V_37500 [Streptomyces sp. MB22_4]|uniref:hypothetical protein n=1 Tax=Streptomyces sp. MB22_4 TaxID=3383120 RepID=UPI0039A12D9D